MSNGKHSSMSRKDKFTKASWLCFRTVIIIIFFSSTQADIVTNTDSTGKNRQVTQNEILGQYSQTVKLKPAIKSVTSEIKSDFVKKVNLQKIHKTDLSKGFKHISPGAELKTVNSVGSNIHTEDFNDVAMKGLMVRALKMRKPRSVHTPGQLADTNHTTPKPDPASVAITVISPTPVLPSVTSERHLAGEQYESPQEIQDDKNEDMLQILNARGFSYTVLPDDMMSKYPDIVAQVDADEMEVGEGQGGEGQGTGQGQDIGVQGHGEDNEAKETDGKDNEGPEEEGNEAGESDNEQDDNEQPESLESAQNQTESESSSRNSSHGEQPKHELQSSMKEMPGGSTGQPNNRQDYDPYYNMNKPGHTALPAIQPSIVAHRIYQLPHEANRNSGQKQPGGTPGTTYPNSGQYPPAGVLPLYQLNNVTDNKPGQNRQPGFPQTHSGQSQQPGYLPMHQLHNVGNANAGQGNPGLGFQSNAMGSPSTPTRSKTVSSGLPASTVFGIVAGCLIGSWMILGPMICLVCKYRDSRQEKRKRFNHRLYHSDSNNGITEAMVMSELGKEPLRLKHSNMKLRESTYSEKSDTFHDAYETPPLLL